MKIMTQGGHEGDSRQGTDPHIKFPLDTNVVNFLFLFYLNKLVQTQLLKMMRLKTQQTCDVFKSRDVLTTSDICYCVISRDVRSANA